MNKVEVNVDVSSSRDLCYIRIASENLLTDQVIAGILESLVTKIREGETNEQSTDLSAVQDANETNT